MRKHLHIVSFLFILMLVSTVTRIVAQTNNDTTNQRSSLKKTGYWEEKWANGKIKSKGYYVRGKRVGNWKFYSKDGKSYYQGTLIDGKRNGWWYLTSTDDNTKLDGTNWIKGRCVGHATMSW